MSTLDETAVAKMVVARLLAYVSPAAISVATLTGSKVYVSQAPDNTTGLYVVVRIINGQTDAQFNNLKENFDIECMCFGRPRSAQQSVESLGTVVKQALLSWRDSSLTDGLTFGQTAQRDVLPPNPDPADRELVQVRVVVSCTTWPTYLTSVT